MEGTKKKHIKIGCAILFCILLGIYLGVSFYFKNHFYFNTNINGHSVSGKTVDEIENELMKKSEKYVLQLKELDNKTEEIKGKDINLKYDIEGKVQAVKDKENPFAWISSIFKKKEYKLDNAIIYDNALLDEAITKLSAMDLNNVVEPKNPVLEYKDGKYNIIDEVEGNKLKEDVFKEKIIEAINGQQASIDLENLNCYEKPKYTSKSDEVKKAKDTLDKYVSTKITYEVANTKDVLDASIVNKWLNVDNEFNVVIDEDAVANYAFMLASKYNTWQGTRNFVTSEGKTIKVSGGNYGWIINKDEEQQELIKSVKNGEQKTRKPIYLQTALVEGENDVGNTYVEINLTKQYIWYYKDGQLVTEGKVVTGMGTNEHATPPGTYQLNYKERNATLKGENYETKVSYWMPFNNDIGIHDATWRKDFGGEIYMNDGSHGCVNAPYNLAGKIFESIQPGMPVICY